MLKANVPMPTPVVSDNENIAIKHTGAIHMANTLTLLQRKAANVLLKYAYENLKHCETHCVRLADIARDLGWSENSNANEKLKNAIRKLNVTQVEWNILGKDSKNEWGVATILAEATIKDGYCIYAYSPTMRKLQANPNLYARIDLMIQKNFDRSYSLVLWEFLIEALCSAMADEAQTAWVDVDDFRRLMGVDTPYYQNFSKFNSKIMVPAVKEVNQKADLETIMHTKRCGRAVGQISFHVKRRPRRPAPEITSTVQPQVEIVALKNDREQLKRVLQEEFEFTPRQAHNLVIQLHDVSREQIEETLNSVRKRQAAGTIKRVCAYTKTALKDKLTEQQAHAAEQLQPLLPIEESYEAQLHPKWQKVRLMMREKLGEPVYRSWIYELQLGELEHDAVELIAKNRFICDWITSHYAHTLLMYWQQYDAAIKDLRLKVIEPAKIQK